MPTANLRALRLSELRLGSCVATLDSSPTGTAVCTVGVWECSRASCPDCALTLTHSILTIQSVVF